MGVLATYSRVADDGSRTTSKPGGMGNSSNPGKSLWPAVILHLCHEKQRGLEIGIPA